MSYSSVYFSRMSSNVHFWEYDDEGNKKHLTEKAPLYFYMKSDKGDFTSIYGDTLKKMVFESWNEYKESKEMFKAAGRELFESDVDIDNRFILDRYSSKEMKIPKLDVHFLDIEVHSEKGFPKATLAEHPITIITIYSTKDKKYYIFSEKDFDRSRIPENSWVKIFPTEQELLKTFIAFIRKKHPDIISGWNSNGFDIPYIINRSYKLLGKEITDSISPIKNVRKLIKKLRFGKTQEVWEIAGINLIDYMDLYKKYHQGEQESFKLDYIAKVETGEQKLKYEGTLKELYHNDWQKYVEYNIQDVNLLKKIDERIKFMDLMVGICYNCKVPFDQFQKTTKVLDGAFMSRLMLDKIILPDVKELEEGEDQYIGAYVKDPRIGMYDWVMSYDATSLYPSIMMQHNISPETKMMVAHESVVPIILDAIEGKPVDENEMKMYAVDQLTCSDIVTMVKEKGYTISVNGVVYRHDKAGVVASFVKEWFDKRNLHKKLMEKAIAEGNHDEAQLQKGLQQNYKILINSVYGYVGSKFSRLYDKDNAVAVTSTGQEVLKTTMKAIDVFFKEKWPNTETGKKLNAKSVDMTIIYGDTDSVYADIGVILKSINYPHYSDNNKCKEFVDKQISDMIFKIIRNAMQILTIKRMNCKSCMIDFKREMIARRAFFLSKKHYVAWVMKMETKDVPEGDDHEIEAKGIEMVKSSTPELIRGYMKKFLTSLLKNVDNKKSDEELKVLYKSFREVEIEKISKITNVNNIGEYTGPDGMPIKGTPNHVKAAIGFNNFLESKGLQDSYEQIFEGDKVKVIYIKESPLYKFNSIAFKDVLPPEFAIKELVDHDIMWDKVFAEPMKQFYDLMKWDMPNFEQEDITDLFS